VGGVSDQEARDSGGRHPKGRSEAEHAKRSAGVVAGRAGPSGERRPPALAEGPNHHAAARQPPHADRRSAPACP